MPLHENPKLEFYSERHFYIKPVIISVCIYIYSHIHVGYCSQLFVNQLNSQFKSINLKFNVSVYSHRISLPYTWSCYDTGFDTEFLQIVPCSFT